MINFENMRRILAALLIAVFILPSCLKRDEFSDIPIIEYKSISQFENSLIVRFSFTDGNGDIGLKEDEDYYPFGPCDPHYKNLVVDPYRTVEGEFILARKVVPSDCGPDSITTFDTVGYDQRIKYIVPETRDKTLEGDIEVTLNEVLEEFPNDTIKFKLRLYDRALNASNEIETEVVITL